MRLKREVLKSKNGSLLKPLEVEEQKAWGAVLMEKKDRRAQLARRGSMVGPSRRAQSRVMGRA